MLHPAIVFGLVFQWGLKLYTGGMTITAKGLTMADCADPLILISNHTVRIRKLNRMIITLEIKRLFAETMALGAELSSFSQFMNNRMGGREPVRVLRSTGNKQHQQ